jgi:hypothetical protein
MSIQGKVLIYSTGMIETCVSIEKITRLVYNNDTNVTQVYTSDGLVCTINSSSDYLYEQLKIAIGWHRRD